MPKKSVSPVVSPAAPASKLSAQDVAKLSDYDVFMRLARESLARFGTTIPPGFGSMEVPRRASEGKETDWSKVFHTCPKCGKHSDVESAFGIRPTRAGPKRQSWCRECRATNNYHAKPYSQPSKR